MYGPELGATAAGDEDNDGDEPLGSFGTRLVKAGHKVKFHIFKRVLGLLNLVNQPFYTADEIRSFRTLGLEPGKIFWGHRPFHYLFIDLQTKGIKILGFKDLSELRFEDNIKHSQFIYPDELVSSDRRLLYSYRLDLSFLVVLGQQKDI